MAAVKVFDLVDKTALKSGKKSAAQKDCTKEILRVAK